MDMDKYIKERRSKNSGNGFENFSDKLSEFKDDVSEWKLFSLFRKRKSKTIPFEDDDDDDYSAEESEIEAIEELEDELEERRESILKRFFRKLRFSSRKVDEDEIDDYDDENYDDEDEIDDVREVIKITHKWLERLPPEEIERFKRSDDFVKYKAVLKKLNMIK